ncbi:MAG: hypothetical protein WCI18_14520 [Pseudomonadota bacterium]
MARKHGKLKGLLGGIQPHLYLFSMFFLISARADGEVLYDEFSTGAMALRYRLRNNSWADFVGAGIDGEIQTTPPGSKESDRRLESLSNVGVDRVIGGMGVRVNLKSYLAWNRREDTADRVTLSDEHKSRWMPSVDATYVTPKGLELGFGGMLWYEKEHQKTFYSQSIRQSVDYSGIKIWVPRLSILRRSGTWNGGFYYNFGRSQDRSVALRASDGSSLSTSQRIHSPTEFGIIADFSLFGFLHEVELSQIESLSTSDVSSDGKSVEDDFIKMRATAFFPLTANSLVSICMSHRTLGYSSNAFVTIDTIPMTLVRAKLIGGTLENQVYLSLFYGQGQDELSIPEANEFFKVRVFGSSIGIILSI